MLEQLPLLAWPGRPALTTLIFHRVLSKADPLRAGDPTIDQFDARMRFMARNFTVLPLAEAIDLLQKGRLPRRACCITFDDGYADNLTNALPVLEAYRLPATVFVASGYLDGGRMFNDAIIDGIAASGKSRLDLREIDLGVHELQGDADRQAAVVAILETIKHRPPELRDRQISRFLELAECGPLSTDIMLTTAQMRELADRGVEIGGHTVAHTILTTLDDTRAFAEISGGKQALESILGRPVTSFAYPNGKPGRDYSAEHVALARRAGFERAVSTAPGVGRPDTDIYQVPRFTPWATKPVKVAAQLLRNAWS